MLRDPGGSSRISQQEHLVADWQSIPELGCAQDGTQTFTACIADTAQAFPELIWNVHAMPEDTHWTFKRK